MAQAVCLPILSQSTCITESAHVSSNKVSRCAHSSEASLFYPATIAVSKGPVKDTLFGQQVGLKWTRPKQRIQKSYGRTIVITNVAASETVFRTAPYERIGDCLVYPSLKSGKTKGIIHFLGGAFIGAAPEAIYSLLIELLAKEGFLIVATPYNLSFNHAASAVGIHERFNSCLSLLSKSGFQGLSPNEISDLPIYSVGHSMGALMQVLIGSTCTTDKLPEANAVISFNNKPAADAIPFFDQMGVNLAKVAPIVESSPVTEFARAFSAETIRAVLDSPLPLPPIVGDNLQSVRQFLDQIPAVFDQVSQGVSDFTPTPAENRITVSRSYAVPNNLLVKFADDAIDETDTLEELLMPRAEILGGRLTKLVLNGNHLTPVAPDVKWEVGREYTAVDAIVQVVKNVALADLRALARNIADWFSSL